MAFLFEVLTPTRQSYLLSENQPELTIGRGPNNEIRIDDIGLSRTHARLFWTEGRAFAEDLGSRNGSFVNGERIQEVREIYPGDRLELGRAVLSVHHQDTAIVELSQSRLFPLKEVQQEIVAAGNDNAKYFENALLLLQNFSLDLLKDDSLEDQLQRCTDELVGILEANRIAVMLRDSEDRFTRIASSPTSSVDIPVSRTTIAAICDSHQAMLVESILSDPNTKSAKSIMASSLSTLMAAPLECENSIEGLIYADRVLPAKPFTVGNLALMATVAHLLAARIRTVRLLAEKERTKLLEQEMQIARKMQRGLLPAEIPNFPGWECDARSWPSRQVSGDLYGLWTPVDDYLYGAVADVSGKGAGPGLLMACLVAYTATGVKTIPDTADLATVLSTSLAQHTSSNRFATAILFKLNLSNGIIQITNAGHNPGFLVRADGRIEKLNTTGLPLAMLPGKTPYGQLEFQMEAGDLLFLYTDGITEASAPDGEEFGSDRLQEFLNRSRLQPLKNILTQLQTSLKGFTQSDQLTDDQTLLIFRKTEAPC